MSIQIALSLILSLKMSSAKSNQTQENDLEQILAEVEDSLSQLQSRHEQVKQDLAKRSQLQERQQELKQQQQNKSLPQPLKTELRQLKQEQEEIL